jgi:uncharacterized protein (DUF302 family)
MLLVSCSVKSQEIFEYESTKSLNEVMQDAVFAITENNFSITGDLHIGKTIQERGNPEFPMYEVILFCNLSYAQEMLTIDPTFINYCPYRVSIREHNQKIIIGTMLLPEKTGNSRINEFAKKINTILSNIVKYAAEEDPFLLFEDDDV